MAAIAYDLQVLHSVATRSLTLTEVSRFFRITRFSVDLKLNLRDFGCALRAIQRNARTIKMWFDGKNVVYFQTSPTFVHPASTR